MSAYDGCGSDDYLALIDEELDEDDVSRKDYIEDLTPTMGF